MLTTGTSKTWYIPEGRNGFVMLNVMGVNDCMRVPGDMDAGDEAFGMLIATLNTISMKIVSLAFILYTVPLRTNPNQLP